MQVIKFVTKMTGVALVMSLITVGCLAQQAAKDTIAVKMRHLDSLDDATLLSRANLDFMGRHLDFMTSKDRLFHWCLTRPAMIDSLIGNESYANVVVNVVIYNEMVKARLRLSEKTGREPDWKAIEKQIRHTYSTAFARNNILQGRIVWYKSTKNASLYAHYLTIQLDEQVKAGRLPPGFWATMKLNNTAFEVFTYGTIRADLRSALRWTDQVIGQDSLPSGGHLDTKANLLYKLGQKQEALQLEARAVKLKPADKEIAANYQKMLALAPTWPAKME